MKMGKLEKQFVNSKRRAQSNIKLIEKLIRPLEDSNIKKVLEVGCGVGAVAAHLARTHGYDVVGTDLDPEQIELAGRFNEKRWNLRFIEADTTLLPFEDDEFDLVLSMKVIHHIKNWQTALGEIRRVLKPNGYHLFNDIALSSTTSGLLRILIKIFAAFTFNDILDWYQKEAFKIEHQRKPVGFILKHFIIVAQK